MFDRAVRYLFTAAKRASLCYCATLITCVLLAFAWNSPAAHGDAAMEPAPGAAAGTAMGLEQHVPSADLMISTSAVIPVSIGLFFGQKLHGLMPADVFKRVVLVIVLLSGLGLIFKAFIPH